MFLLVLATFTALKVGSVDNNDYSIVSSENYSASRLVTNSGLYVEQEISLGIDAYNHSPSVAALPNGKFISLWYAGDREGGTDMKLKTSMFANGSWSEPKILISRDDVPSVTRRIGNAIVYVHPETPEAVTVVFTSTLGGWATSYLNVIVSHDGGESWGAVKRLVLGNIFNFSHLVRCAPLFLSGGRVAIPAYHEFLNKFGVMVILDAKHQVQETVKLSFARDGIQPCVAVSDNVPVRAFLRTANSGVFENKLLSVALNEDFSPKSAVHTVEATNEDTSIALANFNDSKVLAFNDSLDKKNLSLALIDGIEINKFHVVTEGYSGYPYLIKQRDTYHLVYNKDKTIMHVMFDEKFVKNNAEIY